MLEQRLWPACEVQPGDSIEPRQRFLRIASMKVDYPVFYRHYCLRPQRSLPCWQFDSN